MIILMAVAVISTALFMIGGAVQDVDMHDLAEYPVQEQAEQYQRLESRRELGEAIQLWSAMLMLASFMGIAVYSLIIASQNREKPVLNPVEESIAVDENTITEEQAEDRE